MRLIRITGVALVAVFAFSAVTVASASASYFLASKSPGLLLGKLKGENHKFKTVAGTVECSVATAHGPITALLTTLQLVNVSYSSCKFGIFSATVSNAHYLFHSNGTATLDNEVTIVAAGFCTALVKPQGPLSTIKYLNNAGGKDIEVDVNVTNIHYILHPGCPSAGLHTDGTYTGVELVFEDGGELSWHA